MIYQLQIQLRISENPQEFHGLAQHLQDFVTAFMANPLLETMLNTYKNFAEYENTQIEIYEETKAQLQSADPQEQLLAMCKLAEGKAVEWRTHGRPQGMNVMDSLLSTWCENTAKDLLGKPSADCSPDMLEDRKIEMERVIKAIGGLQVTDTAKLNRLTSALNAKVVATNLVSNKKELILVCKAFSGSAEQLGALQQAFQKCAGVELNKEEAITATETRARLLQLIYQAIQNIKVQKDELQPHREALEAIHNVRFSVSKSNGDRNVPDHVLTVGLQYLSAFNSLEGLSINAELKLVSSSVIEAKSKVTYVSHTFLYGRPPPKCFVGSLSDNT